MKLLLAIINNDDAHTVNTQLSKSGFFITKISSTGGFLMNGNSTFLIGLNDDDVDDAIAIIKKYTKERQQPTPVDLHPLSTAPTQVTVGGATVFVLNIEHYEHL